MTEPSSSHGTSWHTVGECGYCDFRRAQAAEKYFDEHPEFRPKFVVRTGPEPTFADLFPPTSDRAEPRLTVDTITSDQLDALYERIDRLREQVHKEREQMRASFREQDAENARLRERAEDAERHAHQLAHELKTADARRAVRRRAERAEAAIEAVAEVIADHEGDEWAAHSATTAVRAALNEPKEPTTRLDRAPGIVAYRSRGGRFLLCRAHHPGQKGIDNGDFVEVTSEDLPDGGVCTYPTGFNATCDADVLITPKEPTS